MAAYSVFFRQSVERDFKAIPAHEGQRIMARISELSQNPRPPGCEKLSTLERYRVRLGRYRIIYSIQDKSLTVWVVKVGHRKDVYR